MKRKVNRVGQNTLTVSLPSKWARNKNIGPGDEVDVSELDEGLLIATKRIREKNREITLSIDDFSYYRLARYLAVVYRMGYDKIILMHNNADLFNDKNGKSVNLRQTIRKLVDRNMGSEIVSQTAKKTEIECFVSDEAASLERIEKRIHFLFKETLKEVLNATKEDYKTFHESIYAHHDNIAKFINYYLREVDGSNMGVIEKQMTYSLYMIIDKLLDKMRHLSEKISKHGMTSKVREHIEAIFSVLDDLFTALHKREFSRELVKKRYDVVHNLDKERFTLKEYYVIAEVKIFLDVINDFTELIVAKNL